MARAQDLTDNQRNFFEAYLVNGRNASKAYREAYNTTNMSANAVQVEASRLLKHPNVAKALDAAEAAAQEAANITLETHVVELDRLKRAAEKDKIHGAAVRAEELRGKATGLYVERQEHTYQQSAEQIIADMDAGPIAKTLVRHILEGYPADDATVIMLMENHYSDNPVEAEKLRAEVADRQYEQEAAQKRATVPQSPATH